MNNEVTKADLVEMFSGLETRLTEKIETEIADLAQNTSRGFTAVERRLDRIDERLDRLEMNHSRRLDNLEEKVSTISAVLAKT